MSTPAMMPALEHAQAALAGIPGLVSCEIGRKEDVSPNDYPMIQIVPTRVTPGAAYAGRTIEVWIYFGVPIEKVDELENVYEGLSALESQILDILGTIQGQYRETITDQDFFETYKLAAIRAELTAPDTPHVKCAIYGDAVAETLGGSPTLVAPFTNILHNSDAADWTPALMNGSITRLLNGDATTRTRVTLAGLVAGAAASEVAIGIYAVYLDTHLVGTVTGFVLAHTMLAIPFVLIAVQASLEVFDRRLETAAGSLGANRLTVFRTVTLPLILPGVLSGALFAFITSFDEIIVALFITSPYLKTLPVQIYTSITRDADPTVAAVGTLLFLATSLIIIAGLLLGMRRGRT